MNKQELASKIWESANKMRSKIDASEYKDYILGFMFYKFLSEREEKFLIDNDFSQEDIVNDLNEDNDEVLKFVRNGIGYFISYDNLFSTWIKLSKDFTVVNVSDALSAFNRQINNNYKKIFEGIFTTLETGLSKLGDTSGARTKAILALIELIDDIPMDENQGYDVLGYVYEYLISNFAENAGKKAGEFYTPHEVSVLMSEIIAEFLKGKETIKIYDPTSGSGSLLINIGNSVAKRLNSKDAVRYYAQELKENTFNLTRMNLVMRGITPQNITVRNADTLEEDWPWFDENDPAGTYEPLYVDAVVSNPPYSQSWDPKGKENDARYSNYGIAPKSKADYAFLLHDLFHVKPDGLMTIVLPHGVLFRGGEEGEIRKNLIEKNKIDTIIGLPPNIFFGTGIPTIIMVLKQHKNSNDILIIDASKGFVKEGKKNRLRARDIKKIVDCVNNRSSVEKFSRIVEKDEIRENDYNLNIPRYVDSSEDPEHYDLYSSMYGGIPNDEIEKFSIYWQEMPNLKSKLFEPINKDYSQLINLESCNDISTSEDVASLKNKYIRRFEKFDDYLSNILIDNMLSIDIKSAEEEISKEVYNRVNDSKIVDFYSLYQALDDKWKEISVDLEILQTEGVESLNKVDPNMVVNNKNVEKQDGWVGRILPFDLVQQKLLKELLDKVNSTQIEIENIDSELSNNIDELDEDIKDSVLNDNNDAFKKGDLKNKVKEINAEVKETGVAIEDGSSEFLLIESLDLLDKQAKLKKEFKVSQNELHEKTKSTIENLSKDEAINLLKVKWIDELVNSFYCVFDDVVDNFALDIKSLCEKYEETLGHIDKEINDVENSIGAMLEDLTGNDYDMKAIEELKNLLEG